MTLIDSQIAQQTLQKTRLYQTICAEKAEILRHKWLESEKAGRDIGFDFARIDWIFHHRAGWRRSYIANFEAGKKA